MEIWRMRHKFLCCSASTKISFCKEISLQMEALIAPHLHFALTE
jgi:hypothetical protein